MFVVVVVVIVVVVAVVVVVVVVFVVVVVVVVVFSVVVVVVVVEALRVSYFGLWRHTFDLPSRDGVEVSRSAKKRKSVTFELPSPQ